MRVRCEGHARNTGIAGCSCWRGCMVGILVRSEAVAREMTQMEYYPHKELVKAKREARKAAKWRGHDMGKFIPNHYWPYQATATCKTCGKTVTADGDPAPNGIDVGGEAVALSCDD